MNLKQKSTTLDIKNQWRDPHKKVLGIEKALKYLSDTDIVRPICQIVSRREETIGHSVQRQSEIEVVICPPESISVRPEHILSDVADFQWCVFFGTLMYVKVKYGSHQCILT